MPQKILWPYVRGTEHSTKQGGKIMRIPRKDNTHTTYMAKKWIDFLLFLSYFSINVPILCSSRVLCWACWILHDFGRGKAVFMGYCESKYFWNLSFFALQSYPFQIQPHHAISAAKTTKRFALTATTTTKRQQKNETMIRLYAIQIYAFVFKRACKRYQPMYHSSIRTTSKKHSYARSNEGKNKK